MSFLQREPQPSSGDHQGSASFSAGGGPSRQSEEPPKTRQSYHFRFRQRGPQTCGKLLPGTWGNRGLASVALGAPADGFPGTGLRSKPGYEDADAPSGKESPPGLPPIPGKVWGGGLESSARRARPVTVRDTGPGPRLCPHLVDARSS